MRLRPGCPRLGAALASLFVLASFAVRADDASYPTFYELSLVNLPQNSETGMFLPVSMQQSLELTQDFYAYAHREIMRRGKDPEWEKRMITQFDIWTAFLPVPSFLINHELWHYAAFSNQGVKSHVGIVPLLAAYTAPNMAQSAELKRRDPAHAVRVDTAGLEGDYELQLALEKRYFFFGDRITAGALPKLTRYGVDLPYGIISYLVSGKDFFGDPAAYVFDLFRPNEVLEEQDAPRLTDRERRYLRQTVALSFLNLVDPFYFKVREFKTSDGSARWNANLRHHLTPFGYSVEGNLFWRNDQENLKLLGRAKAYVNARGVLPGIDVELLRYPVTLYGERIFVSPRVALWLQPENQRFRDEESKVGGLVAARLSVPVSSQWEVFGEVAAKSEGWVPGDEYLDDTVAFRAGLTFHSR